MAGNTLAVSGLQDLTKAFNRGPADLKREYRRAYRGIAEPIRQMAESTAMGLGNIPQSPQWGRMRIGANQKLLYVAPKQRGVKVKGGTAASRPNLARILLYKAMIPALERHEHATVRKFEDILATVGRNWER